ncbi:MAG: hypothetical protein L7U68_08770 [Flavobacteriaceae bacterium]|nr:hypothetical protein [Flavobacteriaceae bacterium]
MRKIVILLLFFVQLGWAQIDLSPYEITLTSEVAFAPATEEIDQMRLSFEAQGWPIEVLKYTMFRLRQNPYLVSTFFIQLTIIHPDQSKKLLIPVPINERYIKAFRTEEGFNESYYDFLSDTYEWIIEGL